MKCSKPVCRSFFVMLALCATQIVATAEAAGPTVWELKGRGGSVLLLGSIHLMRQSDYPLPPVVGKAYDQVDHLLMELDIDSLDPIMAQGLIVSMGRLEEGKTLRDVMGRSDYRLASDKISDLGMDLEMLNTLKPWFVSITVMNLQMMRVGFQPQFGLEQYLSGLARQDGKSIDGLETMEFQLGLFDGLSEKTQSRLLLQTLDEAADMEQQLDVMTAAWRSGDLDVMAAELARSFKEYPDVYESLVVNRNR
ncbi:MAG: TraB/GumN family protein, partial [Gammaproteobacteria bacterium]